MYSDIVFVEKPGVGSTTLWSQLLVDHHDTRIMMTKNNQYRENIAEMAQAADPKKGVTRINWINDNRVPKPGSWFTNKELAFGGVSRDLMPHLLSLYQMFEPDWRNSTPKWAKKERRWNLEDLTDSDYGEVDPNGVYDVDDFAYIDFGDFQLQTNWRACASSNVVGDDIAVHTQTKSFELGLCPELAYHNMITTALWEKSNDKFWQQQMEMDLWIHPDTGQFVKIIHPQGKGEFVECDYFVLNSLEIRVESVSHWCVSSDIDMMNGKFTYPRHAWTRRARTSCGSCQVYMTMI